MNLLIISENKNLEERFAPYFDHVKLCSMADICIRTENTVEVLVENEPMEDYDAVYIDYDPCLIIFTRLLLESLLGKDLVANIDANSVYIVSKKPYMYAVLKERGVPVPNIYLSSEKGVSDLLKDMKFPTLGIKLKGFSKKETRLLESAKDVFDFAEGIVHGQDLIIFMEMVEGDVFESLVINGEVVSSVKMQEDFWKRSNHLKYHSLPDDLRKLAIDASEAIGAKICAVRMKGNYVIDVKCDINLEKFEKLSGKDCAAKIAKALKREEA